MGIERVVFPQKNKYDFAGLDMGVKGLADFTRRGALGWQQEISRIAAGEPPHPTIDAEARDVIDHALTSKELTGFFVNAAKSPSWINWLDQQGYLNSLFSEGKLEDQDVILSQWVADQFIKVHSDSLFSIISNHYKRLNWHFWNVLLRELVRSEENQLRPQTLSQWVHVLMNCVPIKVNEYFLLKLMNHSAEAGEHQSFLQVYDVITVRLASFLPDFEQSRNDSWDDTMKELWGKCLKSNFQHVAHTLLERATMRLEQRHSERIAWNQDDDTTDYDCYRRSAIEPHEQDQFPYRIDSLIDVARDCLEWLVIHDLATARSWCNRFCQCRRAIVAASSDPCHRC